MRGSQCDAIEGRRKVIKEVLLKDADRIAGKIALGTLVKVKHNCHGEEVWEPDSLLFIRKEVDKIMGIREY